MNVAATCDLYITAKTAKCRCSIEGLRHSWATLAIASGAAIADVSVAMGHTTTRMVIEHYMMSTRAVSKRATDAAGRAIEEGLEAYAMAA